MFRTLMRWLVVGWKAFGLGEIAWGHGDEHEVIVVLSRQIQAEPEMAQWRVERAGLYARHGDFQLALADLQQAEALDAGLEVVKALRGRVFYQMGRPVEARALQETYLHSHPDHVQVRLELCDTLLALGEAGIAMSELDALITASEQPSPDVVARRLELCEQQGPHGVEAALTWLTEFLQHHPLTVFEETALRYELKLGRTTAALQRLDKLIAGAARPEAWLLQKAEVLAAQGQTEATHATARSAMAAWERLPEGQRTSRAGVALRSRLESLLTPATP